MCSLKILHGIEFDSIQFNTMHVINTCSSNDPFEMKNNTINTMKFKVKEKSFQFSFNRCCCCRQCVLVCAHFLNFRNGFIFWEKKSASIDKMRAKNAINIESIIDWKI